MSSLPARFTDAVELGRGSMGAVFRATDTTRGDSVAIKQLLSGLDEDSLVRRFQREVASMEALHHPNVVSMREVLSHDGQILLVMEYLEGGTLAAFIARDEPLPRIIEAFVGIGAGLAHIHSQGFVHRDLKPENILFSRDGIPKIGDLGIARRLEPQSMLTAAGTILGSYAYLAPEQVLSSGVTPAADLYSLGVCLYQAVARRLPFQDKSLFALLQSHLKKAPPPLRELRPEIPETLHDLVHALLEKKPESRPTSALEVTERLQACRRDAAAAT